MLLTPRQIDLVRTSFALVMPVSITAADRFYARLFAVAPETRGMFSGDIAEQGKKLMLTLANIVADLTQLDRLATALATLGRRHAGYGVEPHHYSIVGDALLWTLGDALGPRFESEVEQAWAAAYQLVAEAMIAGGEQPA